MKINISPVNKTFNNCFEAVLANIAGWKNRNYELMYINEWNFKFNHQNEDMVNCLGKSLDSFVNISNPLNKYHGIKFVQTKCIDFGYLPDIIKRKLQYSPVTVKMDTFECPWDKNYKKKHINNHIFFINGIEAEQGILYCTDPFYMVKDQKLTFEDFDKGYTGEYGFFQFYNNKSINCIKLLEELVISIMEKDIFGSIRNFADEINKKNSFSNEMHGFKEAWETPLFKNIFRIANGRKTIPILLTYIASNCNNNKFVIYIDWLELINDKWVKIKDLILRLLISYNDMKRLQLVDLLYSIAKEEEYIASHLLNICLNKL